MKKVVMRLGHASFSRHTGGLWAVLVGMALLLSMFGGCTPRPSPTSTLTLSDVNALITQADRAYQAQDWAQAAELYDQLVRIQPDVAEWWIRFGWSLRATRRYEDALQAFARADALDPNAYWSAYGEGLTYWNLRRYDDALAAFQRAIRIDPTRPGPHEWRGRIYLRLKHYDAALDAALYGLHYLPEDQDLHNILQEAQRRLRWQP